MLYEALVAPKVYLGGQSLGVQNPSTTCPFIGTLTFIEPLKQRYGALGHFLPNGWLTGINNFRVKASTIKSIRKPKNDSWGSKIGSLIDSGLSGTIRRNTHHGIFGEIDGFDPNPYFKDPISVATLEEVELGPAAIYTVIEDETIEEFAIVIESLIFGRKKTPYFALKMVDPNLIERAGGIIKGMSGSPIVQNGKLIGAVSHLSAADSERGYGLYIGKMLNDLQWPQR